MTRVPKTEEEAYELAKEMGAAYWLDTHLPTRYLRMVTAEMMPKHEGGGQLICYFSKDLDEEEAQELVRQLNRACALGRKHSLKLGPTPARR